MTTVRVHRWDEIALDKITEMISQKIIAGEREMLAQIYLKRGALVPMHAHESEQMTYILQGALKCLVGGEEITGSRRRGAPHPVGNPASGRSARGYVRARRVQPGSRGLGRDRALMAVANKTDGKPLYGGAAGARIGDRAVLSLQRAGQEGVVPRQQHSFRTARWMARECGAERPLVHRNAGRAGHTAFCEAGAPRRASRLARH